MTKRNNHLMAVVKEVAVDVWRDGVGQASESQRAAESAGIARQAAERQAAEDAARPYVEALDDKVQELEDEIKGLQEEIEEKNERIEELEDAIRDIMSAASRVG
jgi:archaellum component FlaC